MRQQPETRIPLWLQAVVCILRFFARRWHVPRNIRWQTLAEWAAVKRSHRMNRAQRRRVRGKAVTDHARKRMTGRRISPEALEAVLTYGREVYVRGAQVYAIGKKEVERYQRDGIDLSAYEGIQVVCSVDDTVMTTYRNHDFRGLRPRSRNNYYRREAA